MRNDAIGALSALSKGSFSSTFLQQCTLCSCCLEHSNTLHLHAPGRVLIDEGVDDLSHDSALEVAGPVSGLILHSKVLQLAQLHDWHLTIDALSPRNPTLS